MSDVNSVPATPPNGNRPRFGRKITPGPFQATKSWEDYVGFFREAAPRKKHWRCFKFHNDCFSATEAVDILYEFLVNNPNTGPNVTREKTVNLLRKFLAWHIIEDVKGRWGDEDFADDNRLYRLAPPKEGGCKKIVCKNSSNDCLKNVENNGTKRMKTENVQRREGKANNGYPRSRAFSTSSCITQPPSPPVVHRPLPPLPRCKVTQKVLTSWQIDDVWREHVIDNMKRLFSLERIDDLVSNDDIKAEWIRHNATMIGSSGVVRVPLKDDLPFWTLSAMACLAKWPEDCSVGFPNYPGFERDVFKTICNFYCGQAEVSLPRSWQSTTLSSEKHLYAQVDCDETTKPEPLLTFPLYELFTNILCLLRPTTTKIAIEALQHCLLLLPPPNRRKLHLLLRLMDRVSTNPHLSQLSPHIPTRALLLHTFARRIVACGEDVCLDELLALKLTTFLVDHHHQVMKVPDNLQVSVKAKLERLRKPLIRYADDENGDGSFIEYGETTSFKNLPFTKQVVQPKLANNLLDEEPFTREMPPINGPPDGKNRFERVGDVEQNIADDVHDHHRRSSTIGDVIFNLRAKISKKQVKST